MRHFLSEHGSEALWKVISNDKRLPPTQPGFTWEQEENWWAEVVERQDLDSIAARFYPPNECRVGVTVPPFELYYSPVTNEVYRLFSLSHGLIEDGTYRRRYEVYSGKPLCPAIYLNYYDAWVFCKWANWDGCSCRLPHEDEWEYAARANSDSDYFWGDDRKSQKYHVQQQDGTASIDAARSNGFGLIDMLGNVWEWCEDVYANPYSRSNMAKSGVRVLRGGSWSTFDTIARSAYRYPAVPAAANFGTGFRPARDTSSEGQTVGHRRKV
jgi:formylglycine-generating enzyme required for sulfatase activity